MTFSYKTRLLALLLIIVLSATNVTPVFADKKEDKLENELSTLNKDLKKLSSELNNTIAKIKKSTQEIQNLKEELSIVEMQEETQYDAMKARIKYMYENGGTSFFEIILSSGSMVDFIDKCEMVASVTAYDQKALQKLIDTRKEINTKKAELESNQEQLTSLKKSLSSQETELKKKLTSTSTELTNYKKQLAEAERIRNESQTTLEQEKKPTTSSTPTYSTTVNNTGTSITASASDIELFAALIECEAGSTHYDGMLAVASVVVNRMKHPKYPNTLRGVIYQSGQFPPATNGKVAKKLARGVKASCVQVAKDALAGKNNVGDCLRFRSASSGRPGTVIGSNVFF